MQQQEKGLNNADSRVLAPGSSPFPDFELHASRSYKRQHVKANLMAFVFEAAECCILLAKATECVFAAQQNAGCKSETQTHRKMAADLELATSSSHAHLLFLHD